MGTAKSIKEVKEANRELVDAGKCTVHRWATPKGTVGVGGRTGWEVEPVRESTEQ